MFFGIKYLHSRLRHLKSDKLGDPVFRFSCKMNEEQIVILSRRSICYEFLSGNDIAADLMFYLTRDISCVGE